MVFVLDYHCQLFFTAQVNGRQGIGHEPVPADLINLGDEIFVAEDGRFSAPNGGFHLAFDISHNAEDELTGIVIKLLDTPELHKTPRLGNAIGNKNGWGDLRDNP